MSKCEDHGVASKLGNYGVASRHGELEVYFLCNLDSVPRIANDGVLAHVLIVCCELTGLFRGAVVKFVNERVPAKLIATTVLGIPTIDLESEPELHRHLC